METTTTAASDRCKKSEKVIVILRYYVDDSYGWRSYRRDLDSLSIWTIARMYFQVHREFSVEKKEEQVSNFHQDRDRRIVLENAKPCLNQGC